MIVGCNFYILDEFSQPLQQTYLIQLQLLQYFSLVLDGVEPLNGGAIISSTLKIDKRITETLTNIIFPVNACYVFRLC
jgi:hypothetical protein